MDSTSNPQAPQQTQQQQPPQTQPQQQQQQQPQQPHQPPHQQQQRPQIQQHPQQPHPHSQPAAAQVGPYQHMNQYPQQPRQPYIPQQIFTPPYPPYYYYPPPQSAPWNTNPATYPAQPAQPTMVTQQPQSNVPQQHNKSSHGIGSTTLISDQRQLQNSSLQPVTVPNSQASTIASTNTKRRNLAVLKDPKTGKVVPLSDNNVSSSTKNSTPVTKPSPNAEHVTTTLLQKVSEDVTNKEDNKENNAEIKTEKTSSVVQKEQQQQQKQIKQQPSQPTSLQQPNQQQKQQNQQQNDKGKADQVTKVEQNNDKQKQSEQHEPKQNDKKETPVVKKVESAPSTTTVASTTTANLTTATATTATSAKNEQKEPDLEPNVAAAAVVAEQQKVVTPAAEQKPKGQENGEAGADKDAATTTKNEDGDHEAATTDAAVVGGEEEEEEEEPKDLLSLLTFESWQYHPVSNRKGQKIYSRQFLLDVCEKVYKIDPLQQESEDNLVMEGNRLQSAFNERVDLFAPGFSSSSQRYNPTNRQNDASRRQSQQNYAGRSSAGQERQRKVITSVSLTQEVELKTTSNPWRPAKDIKEDAPPDQVETESLKKRFRSILNKLTPNNFDSLAHSVTELNIDTESKLGEVIDIVFAKALAEPGYCVLYGQMCSHLKKISAGATNFANILLKRCQHQFQSDIYAGLNLKERKEKIEAEEDVVAKKQLEEELYEDMYRCRMRGLGLIKFIGELYKIEMLNDKIMLDCIVRLLVEASEESLECLCDLLATIGEKLDHSTSQKTNAEKEKKAPKSAGKAAAYAAGTKSLAAVLASGTAQQQPKGAEQPLIWTLDKVFEELHKIRKNKESDLNVRIRFKLLDTCELRERDNWHSKKTKDNNPKKIDEIREAHKEKLEQERRQQMGPRRSQEGGRRLGHSGGSSNQISSLAMESGGGGGRQSNMHTSSSSHLIRDHSIGDNMKSNHDDIESQKEHQKKLESLKSITLLKNQSSNKTPTLTNESLRPTSHIYMKRT